MEFKKYKLKEIGTIITGKTPPTKNKEAFSTKKDKFLFITPRDMNISTKNISKTERYLTEKIPTSFNSIIIDSNSICVSCIGTVGKVFIPKEFAITNQQINSITKFKSFCNYEYLYYYIKNNNKVISSVASGTTMPIVNKTTFENIEVFLPNIEYQKRVVTILSKIDKKIELNNQINDNLHKLSNELFNRWFVDFDYPNASGKMKETSLGLIPEDWHLRKLSEIADCQNGYAFYKDGYDENGVMVIDLGNINLNGTFIYTNADKYISQERLENNSKYNKYLLHKDDLVMVMTDRKATMDLLGKTGKIYEKKEYLLNQRMYRIRSKINVNYLYTVLNSSKTLNELKSKALGSVQKYVNTGHINELKIIVGTDEIMEKFSQMVNPIFERIENNILENDSLQELREKLLPKLMNGEIDIDKIEI